MNLQDISKEIDDLFGFPSTWTFVKGQLCKEAGGGINIDEDEISEILKKGGLDNTSRDILTQFLMGHEKAHHLQESVSPNHNYEIDKHVMEIEADIIGAWALAIRKIGMDPGKLSSMVHEFDDAYRIGKQVGIGLGSSKDKGPHHPWAAQRHLSFAKGPLLACSFPSIQSKEKRQAFVQQVRAVAQRMRSSV
jgi:hypothetical protein